MKTIRVKICGSDITKKFTLGYYFYNLLSKFYNVEISENPDYIIFHDSDSEYLNYDCVRIMFTGENYTPNFNLTDYATGMDYLTFGDRYYRMPIYLVAPFYSEAELKLAGGTEFTRPINFTGQDLAKKTSFCSFVYSNYLADREREEIFNKLNAYKKINSGGAYLNNTGGRVSNKLLFEMGHKFSIAFENSSRSGYTTEKLINALAAKTIPIYWGNPDIGKEFNTARFINCHDFNNLDEVVERVKQIDQDDDLYLKIINEPVAAQGMDFNKVATGFEDFLKHIFDQPLEKAKRRTINTARQAMLEEGERFLINYLKRKNKIRKFASSLYRPFKKSSFLERLKQKWLAKRVHSN